MNAAPQIITGMTGKTVLVRADFAEGVSRELARLVAALAKAGARVAIIAGFGAPSGDINPALSLLRFRTPLEAASRVKVTFVRDCVGPVAEAGLNAVPFGEAALMENLRFHPDSRRDSRNFAIRLSVLGDYFAVTGPVSKTPVGWLSALGAMLPAPDGIDSTIIAEGN
ncbi:MAG: phosphoglycerate kinase [Mesorhizobium sp.]|nr:phosphoglycerate kinase [Mesorhizobium sp.]